MAGREFFYPFFQTFFYPYINNVANGVLIYLKNEHCNVFSSGFQSFFPSLFAWKKAEEKMLFRGDVSRVPFPSQVTAHAATEADKAEFAPYVREYCRLFGRDANATLRDPIYIKEW